MLSKWFDLVIANGEELARLMTEECGKPLVESRGEVAYGTLLSLDVTLEEVCATPRMSVPRVPWFSHRRLVHPVVC